MSSATMLSLPVHQRLEELGLMKSAKRVRYTQNEIARLAPRAIPAYSAYPYIDKAEWDEFCSRARRLSFEIKEENLNQYPMLPPTHVLDKIEEVQKASLFDTLEVVSAVYRKIERKRVPDPILVGRIFGISDRFVLAEWDEDIRVELGM